MRTDDADNSSIINQNGGCLISDEDANPTFANLADLSIDKFEKLERAFAAIIALPTTEAILAQVVDGFPTRKVFYDNYGGWYLNNPNVSEKDEPSEIALQFIRDNKSNITPSALRIEAKVRSCSSARLNMSA